MGAAGASILRDTSTGLLSSDMVQSSLSLYACTTERSSALHTVGRCGSCKFIHRSGFPNPGTNSRYPTSTVCQQGGARWHCGTKGIRVFDYGCTHARKGGEGYGGDVPQLLKFGIAERFLVLNRKVCERSVAVCRFGWSHRRSGLGLWCWREPGVLGRKLLWI